MKNKFIEHHINESLEKIFNEATIVLDTNSLLNLYRYSKETRVKYLEILSNIENRLFLTYNICSEFYKNRYSLIANRSIFKSILNEIIEEYNGKFINVIKNSSSGNHKHNNALNILKHEDALRNRILKELENSNSKLRKDIESFEDDIDFKYLQKDDPILSNVIRIFENKISAEFTLEEKEKIYKEGFERYKKQVPPGFKDNDKPEPERYGDLLIWKEMQELSKVIDKDILFISDDRKEDWIIDFKGLELGPRKELIKEFYGNTNHLFYSITTKEFIKIISEKFSVKNTELLEKETAIIQEKIQEERISLERMLSNELRRRSEYINTPLRDSFDKLRKDQELLSSSLRGPIEELRKNQELLNSSFRNPLEEFRSSQEMLSSSFRNPLEELRKSQELLNPLFRNPLYAISKNQEFLSNSPLVIPSDEVNNQSSSRATKLKNANKTKYKRNVGKNQTKKITTPKKSK